MCQGMITMSTRADFKGFPWLVFKYLLSQFTYILIETIIAVLNCMSHKDPYFVRLDSIAYEMKAEADEFVDLLQLMDLYHDKKFKRMPAFIQLRMINYKSKNRL